MSKEVERLKNFRNELNAVSPSFCLAKWLQVTLHLHTGTNHSCHHPTTHKTPLEELKNNPSALHNTEYKKQQRKMMLEGIRPKECQYCWNIEDLKEDLLSDRIMKSGDTWARDKIAEIAQYNGNENINPTYLEVSFSNVCNFKCSYCSPTYSSRWREEIETNGPYKTSNQYNNLEWLQKTGDLPYHHKEHNPYVEAFWKWWPDLIQSLQVIRVTGGEPLLDDNTFKIIDYLIDNGIFNLKELAINTNCNAPDKIMNKLIDKLLILEKKYPDLQLRIYTSAEGYGKQAEYSRYGMDFVKWQSNVISLLQKIETLKIVVMATLNVFSLPSIELLMEWVNEVKRANINELRKVPITIDTSILRWPRHLNISILPEHLVSYLENTLDKMTLLQEGKNGNNYYYGFFDFEIEKMKRAIEFMKVGPNKDEHIDRDVALNDLKIFIQEYDRRRGTCFETTFPEYNGIFF